MCDSHALALFIFLSLFIILLFLRLFNISSPICEFSHSIPLNFLPLSPVCFVFSYFYCLTPCCSHSLLLCPRRELAHTLRSLQSSPTALSATIPRPAEGQACPKSAPCALSALQGNRLCLKHSCWAQLFR